jgi:pimeloyl-ACP methyl ester carboxylesterase
VLVIGSSIGGWLAMQMALADNEKGVTGLVLVDSAGVEIEGEPMRDFFSLDARGQAAYSFHDSEKFYVDPATLAPEELRRRAGNVATMRIIAGDPYMHDP